MKLIKVIKSKGAGGRGKSGREFVNRLNFQLAGNENTVATFREDFPVIKNFRESISLGGEETIPSNLSRVSVCSCCIVNRTGKSSYIISDD